MSLEGLTRRTAVRYAVLLLVPALALPTAHAGAQTASALTAIAPRAEKSEGKSAKNFVPSLSVANPWLLGSQIGAQLYGDGGITDDLLLAGKLVRPVVADRPIGLAAFANLGSLTESFDGDDTEKRDDALASLLTSTRGAVVGAQTYWSTEVETWLKAVPFVQGDLRVSRAKSTDADTTAGAGQSADKAATLLQRRLGVGFELQIGNMGKKDRPLTLSFARSRTWADSAEVASVFGDRVIPRYVSEYTAIIPIATRFGAVVEMVEGGRLPDVWRVGLLVITGEQAGDQTAGDQTAGGDGSAKPQAPAASADRNLADGGTAPDDGTTFTLAISAPESGAGTVAVSLGNEIHRCAFAEGEQQSCFVTKLPRDTAITLTATATDGSTLRPWDAAVGCGGSGATCVIRTKLDTKSAKAPFAKAASP